MRDTRAARIFTRVAPADRQNSTGGQLPNRNFHPVVARQRRIFHQKEVPKPRAFQQLKQFQQTSNYGARARVCQTRGDSNNSDNSDICHQKAAPKPRISQQFQQFQQISNYGARAQVCQTRMNSNNSDNSDTCHQKVAPKPRIFQQDQQFQQSSNYGAARASIPNCADKQESGECTVIC